MSFHWHPGEQVRTARFLLKWTVLGGLVGILGGSASALFLVTLQGATDIRLAHPWLLYLLPLGGLLIGLAYHFWGQECEKGNNLILEEIHQPSAGVSSRMAPLILLATVGTHLFGGSAGREGTAVQMGGSLAAWLSRRLGLDRFHTRILLMAGISAGFGSVFGTPLAGTVFGLEVLAVGRLRYDALIPCLVASVVGDWTCTAWGAHHTHYPALALPPVTAWLVVAVLLASLAFALASVLFAELTSWLHATFKRLIPRAPLRPAVGGVLVIALVGVAGTRDYLGLGVPLIVQSFTPEGVATWGFAWKLLFTAVTLGAGFKGGEVTPLFFIGATLGATLGWVLGVPTDFLAALGFVAVFAGAANTPLACTVMGVELFGAPCAIFLALACCSSYIWSGHRGIYLSQRVDTPKTDDASLALETTLALVRRSQRPLTVNLSLLVRLRQRFARRLVVSSPPNGAIPMAESGQVAGCRLGMVCIYLAAGDRRPGLNWRQRLFSRPLYEEIIDLAREAGVWNASVKGAVYGFTDASQVQNGFHPDTGLVNTFLFVELLAPRPVLEALFPRLTVLAPRRLITFTEVEQWVEVSVSPPVQATA